MQQTRNFIIETMDLDFGFNARHRVLHGLDLRVERGAIYGFLGPNGAGKTTTIRLLLGLLNTSRHSIRLFGRELSDGKLEIFSKIGALIEQPSLYEHISGRDNLEITGRIRKINKHRLDEVLELVRLTDAAHKKVKAYSLGMKQRLGLAIALLGQPELLILDEPVNGLDPNGMVEMRELLRNINKEYGTTIFLSSHLLSEIEKLVTHLGILNMGELLFQGTIEDLRNLQSTEYELYVETSDNNAAFLLLQSKFPVHNADNHLIINIDTKEQTSGILQELMRNDIDIYQATAGKENLEDLFLEMTKGYKVS